MSDRPETPLLDTVASPADIRALDKARLPQLADELRQEVISAVSVTGGNIFGAYDFGYRRAGTSSIGDTLYADWNGNGSQGSGEEGIANVTVTLILDVNGDGVRNCGTDTICGNADDVDVVRAVTTTDASGNYSFTALPAGTWIVVVDQGDPGTECFVIVDGTASVYVRGEFVASSGPGSMVGEMALVDHRPRTATVVADTDLDLLRFDSHAFTKLLDEMPKASEHILTGLRARLDRLGTV